MMQKPLFPAKSDWKIPDQLVDIEGAEVISVDIETKDPQLKNKGPGVRRDGKIVGIAVALPEGYKWYYPFGHATGRQFDKANVIRWAKNNLCRPNQPKIGANILYDLDYLYHEGVKVTGPFYDIQVAEPLINENRRSYSLDALARHYLGETKRETVLREACTNHGLAGSHQKHLWKLDPIYSGQYAEGDAEQTLKIFDKQKPILKQQGLEEVFDIETRLIPMLLHMRQTGVKIHMDKLLQLHENLNDELNTNLKKLNGIDIWAAESIAREFDKQGLTYPLTPKTKKPSFVKGWLERHQDPLAQQIVKCRELDKFIGTFLESSLLEMLVGDRIHCQFNQLKSDDYGTVTGRFSSSNPNLQFIPTRTELGKLIRRLFIPDPGYLWCKADYSQIEIRILAHLAIGAGARIIIDAFNNQPDIDYHGWCAQIAGVDRDPAKTINFGIIYGMGKKELARRLGITVEEADLFIKNYFKALPFLKETVDTAAKLAQKRGYIKTILGRRRRFELWEPKDYQLSKKIKAHPDKQYIMHQIDSYGNKYIKLEIDSYGNQYKKGVKRAACYKAFNAADQGSAADIMKIAMVKIWEAGLCNVIKPYITVHDELDFGYPATREGEEAVKEVKYIMENAYKLKIPVLVDIETGPNWGEVKKWVVKAVCGGPSAKICKAGG